MFPTLFRRPLLRDWRNTPAHIPGCLSHARGMAYPLGAASRQLVADELAKLGAGLRLPDIDELVTALKRAARKVKVKADNVIHSIGNAYETALLTLEFNNTNIANVGDATGLRGSSSAGSFYIALHTADMGEAGDQTTNEATFTSYARQAVARSGAGWTVSGNSVSNAANITFPQNTGSDQTVTHFSIGVASSGASVATRYGPLIASGATWLPFTGATDDNLTIPSNPFSVDQRIVVAAAYDGSLPVGTGLTQGAVLWVKAVSGPTITLSTSQGGSTIDITTAGSGVCIRALPLAVRGGIDAVQFATGTLVSKID